jgi:hypothetical protein
MTNADRPFKPTWWIASLVLVAAATGCATNGPAKVGDAWVRTELYFGLTKPGGAVVSDAEWADFLDRSVTPRFPDGLTVVQARGRYRSRDEVQHEEPTGVLIILHPAGGDADARIDALASEYVRRFEQESVLRSDTPARATFVTASGEAEGGAPKKLSRDE